MLNQSPSITRRLSAWITQTDYAALPAEVTGRAKMSLLDWIGSAYSGRKSLTGKIMEKLVRDKGGEKTATLVGCGVSAPPAEAALYNGMISSVMETDDVHEEASLHAGIGVIPAALAVAEPTGTSGRDLITSIVMGYDISARIARAAGAYHYQFWHTTGTCNTFGAAAAAGKLLCLDEERMTMALGLAGTQAAGLWESLNAGATHAKHLHSGKAASNGVLSALLAREGLKGAETILEGEKGFLSSSARAAIEDLRRLTEDFGKPFLIMKNFFKRYACCRACFEGIEAIERILRENELGFRDIGAIRVIMKPMRTWLVANGSPKDVYEAKFSLPFSMALMAVMGKAGLYDFNEENLRDPSINEVMRKVRLVSDPGIAAKARIEVTCGDGRVFFEEPLCCSLNVKEVKEKFFQNMTPLLKIEHIENIIDHVENLEKMEEIKDLAELLKRTPEHPSYKEDP